MTDIEKLESLNLRVAILRDKSNTKFRYSAKDKAELKEDIIEICDVLGEVLADDTLSQEFRERLENETRKQMVLINKALIDLQRMIRVSKNVVGE